MKFSDEGYEALKQLEELREEVYIDQGGKKTIGWGHLVQPADKIDVHTYCTEELANLLLETDVLSIEQRMEWLLHRRLEQCQYDALVCFAYNVGLNALSGSTLLAKLNAGDPTDDAATELGRWVFFHTPDGQIHESRGLHNRRLAEFEMWHGQYPSNNQGDEHADAGSSERHAPPDAGAQVSGQAGEGNRAGQGKGQGGKPDPAAPKRKANS